MLHLAFEDYRRPGSGGGSARTHQINQRLAQYYNITALVSNYSGAKARVEDGINYVPIGLPWGYWGSIISYFIALPFAVWRQRYDLLVEDFAAPMSSCLSPLWSHGPRLAMVQWLDARGKSKQYHVPFWWFEALGLKLHRRYIAVSQGLSGQITARNPQAAAQVIPNGVEPAISQQPLRQIRQDIVFMGRLEKAQKGLDLLLDAYAQVAPKIRERLIIIGDGHDSNWLERQIDELGLKERVVLRGRLSGTDKAAALAQAKLVVMPSRYETFGMVAIEALAAGTAVVAFDIECLREVVPPELGKLVPPFDAGALGQAIVSMLGDDELNAPARGEQRRAFARAYDWDLLAEQQHQAYEAALGGADVPPAGQSSDDAAKAAGAPEPTDTMPGGDKAGGADAKMQAGEAGAAGPSQHSSAPQVDVAQAAAGPLAPALVSIAARHGRPASVAIVGNYGNGNTGDEAILAGLTRQLAGVADLTVLARDAAQVRRLHGLPAHTRVSLASLRAVVRADVLAIGGGGLFGAGMNYKVRALITAALAARRLGKPVALVALGAYADMDAPTRRRLQRLARRSLVVTARDAASAQLLGGALSPGQPQPTVVPDPAGSMAAASPSELGPFVATGRPGLVIALKPAPTPEHDAQAIAHAAHIAAEWVRCTGHDIWFLCLSSIGDFGHGKGKTDKTMAEQVAQMANLPAGNVRILGPDLPPRIAKGIINQASGVISARLHGVIFAHHTGTPVEGMGFESKTLDYCRNAGLAVVTPPFGGTLPHWFDGVVNRVARLLQPGQTVFVPRRAEVTL